MIYWKSTVNDIAACKFGEYFWESVSKGNSYAQSVESARFGVETKNLCDKEIPNIGHNCYYQIFKMQVDPKGNKESFDDATPAGIVGYLSLDDFQLEIREALKYRISISQECSPQKINSDEFLKILYEKFKGFAEFYLSPKCPVNLDPQSRDRAGIPDAAIYFSWIYPVKNTSILLEKSTPKHPNMHLLWIGAFVYFDQNDEVIALNSVSSHQKPQRGSSVHFSPPESLPNQDAIALCEKKRWSRVTIPSMIEKGARYFAWILPNEQLKERKYPEFGSFAYLFCDEKFNFKTPSHWEKAKKIFFPIAPIS